MDRKDIISISICGILIVGGGYLLIRFLNWLLAWLRSIFWIGTGTAFFYISMFAPFIIIGLLVLIVIKLFKK